MFGRFQRKKKAEGESSSSANKYNAKKHTFDGIEFDSGIERNRYIFLKEAELRGEIKNLRTQVVFELLPNIYETYTKHLKTKSKTEQRLVQRKVIYTADFAYTKVDTLEYVVEEVKGSKLLVSRDYPLRVKMMFYFHHIKVKLVTKASEPV